MTVEYSSSFRDEELQDPNPAPIDPAWEEPYKTPRERMQDQASASLDRNPASGYGISGRRNYIPYEKTEEQKAYDRKRKHSRGWYRKGTYIVLPREQKTK